MEPPEGVHIIHDEDKNIYPIALWAMYALTLLTYYITTNMAIPYGRHVRKGWGQGVAVREAWIIMESPALFVMVLVYHHGQYHLQNVPHILLRYAKFSVQVVGSFFFPAVFAQVFDVCLV